MKFHTLIVLYTTVSSLATYTQVEHGTICQKKTCKGAVYVKETEQRIGKAYACHPSLT